MCYARVEIGYIMNKQHDDIRSAEGRNDVFWPDVDLLVCC